MTLDTKALDNAADTFSRSMRALNSMELADLPPELDQDARDLARIIQEHGPDYADTEHGDMTAPLLESLARLVQAAKAADRLASLEVELASLRTDRDGAAEACRMLQEDKARLEQDNARLRAELARVRGNRTEAELRQLKHDLETAGISAFMSPEKLPKEEWYSSAAFCRDVVRRASYVVEDMIAAIRAHAAEQPAAPAPEMPLMARRPRHKDDDLGELYENGKRLCTISGEPPLREPMPGFVLYRIADADEHGLKVIPRTADMPEGAKYRISYTARAGVYYTGIPQLALEASRSGAVSERIEDYRHGQEG